jgi:hypothetical protein
MTAVSCANSADRKAETWERHSAPFGRPEFAVSDGAKGIAEAVARVARARRDDPSAPAPEHGLDVFHTAMEADRVLARHRRCAEAAREEAEAAAEEVAGARRQGVDARGVAGAARAARGQAIASCSQAERLEAARGRARAALDLSCPDGRLHDRPRAEAEVASAVKGLTGPDWSKGRNFLDDPRSPSFLDRMHRRPGSAEPRPEWRGAMAWRRWLRHGRPPSSAPLTRRIRAVGVTACRTSRSELPMTGWRRSWGTRPEPAARWSA